MSARQEPSRVKKYEPILNVPAIVVATLAAMAFVHGWRYFMLSQNEDIDFLLNFAFIPARYDSTILPAGTFPGGWGAEIWTFVTYAFIHADLMHIAFNGVWLLAFGSAVARRFGPLRFLAFFAVTAAAGAAAHLVTHVGEQMPMVGASAAISGFMAAAIRFGFQHGGPLSMWRTKEDDAYRVPAAPLMAALRDPRILAFLAVWFGVNILFGVGTVAIPGAEQSIAWQAHIGGFLAGLVLFALFDPFAGAGGSGRQDDERTLH
jgi:membrane associated rhomboid family serine protease